MATLQSYFTGFDLDVGLGQMFESAIELEFIKEKPTSPLGSVGSVLTLLHIFIWR